MNFLKKCPGSVQMSQSIALTTVLLCLIQVCMSSKSLSVSQPPSEALLSSYPLEVWFVGGLPSQGPSGTCRYLVRVYLTLLRRHRKLTWSRHRSLRPLLSISRWAVASAFRLMLRTSCGTRAPIPVARIMCSSQTWVVEIPMSCKPDLLRVAKPCCMTTCYVCPSRYHLSTGPMAV